MSASKRSHAFCVSSVPIDSLSLPLGPCEINQFSIYKLQRTLRQARAGSRRDCGPRALLLGADIGAENGERSRAGVRSQGGLGPRGCKHRAGRYQAFSNRSAVSRLAVELLEPPLPVSPPVAERLQVVVDHRQGGQLSLPPS